MSGSKCERCVNDKFWCEQCIDNPIVQQILKNLPKVSKFMNYKPVCPYGYNDCIGDPAYIKYYLPTWYQELYGDITPEEAIIKDSCMKYYQCNEEFCCYYDDEDK